LLGRDRRGPELSRRPRAGPGRGRPWAHCRPGGDRIRRPPTRALMPESDAAVSPAPIGAGPAADATCNWL